MNQSEYLLQAFYQDHIENIDVFLTYVESIFGKNKVYDIHKFMFEKYGAPKLGTSRVTYLSKFVVFKVPISEYGFRTNDLEASIISIGEPDDPFYIPLAKSKHFPNCDIPIVVMEKVKEASYDEIKNSLGYVPDFVSAVDMGQVGFTKKGKLVAFDYADL